MGQPLLSDTIRQRRLSFLGHLCGADTGQDHSRALRACIRVLPKTGDEELEDRGKPG